MTAARSTVDPGHAERMDRMYRTQRHIYDLTRKYYLFGRDTLIETLDVPPGGSVLEVGCGTGRNLALIGRRYPKSRLFGLDISAEMIASAEAKLKRTGASNAILRIADATDFDAFAFGEAGFDRVVISYSLSMIPDWNMAIDAAIAALKPGGSLHIADFGQQERLPRIFRILLQAWLKRFHVTPRASLKSVLNRKAAQNGDAVEFHPLGRGYAWLFTYHRSSDAAQASSR
ncbi:class I SAM-dependent methyltransferase [Pararhizobium gei]|uniref:class I SAM-dependent methyltransferase n=1 Tax=Pararhizobium gei TaxID=1395951 RepID=UPI0023DAA402|nr:class I SAM-dependent methyltransferase [Rhizobium gei]